MISFSKLVAIRGQVHNVVGNRFLLHAFGGQQKQQAAGLKTVEERIGVPMRPKRPLVPFMRFYKDIRPELVQQNPSQKMGVLARLAAAKWKLADQPTKDKYNQDFRKDQEGFLIEIARYQNVLTDEQREKVKQTKLLISEKRKSRERRQKARELGKPKHPVPAFTQYLTEQTTKVDKSKVVFKEFAVKMGGQWRNMSEAERAPYMMKYKQDMDAYKTEIQNWEEKMIKSGNKELVRRKSLMETSPRVAAAPKKKTNSTLSPAKTTRVPRAPRQSIVTSASPTSTGMAVGSSSRAAIVEEPQIKVAEEETKAAEQKGGVRKFFKFF